MNKKVVWTIARKDIRAITSNSQVWLAMLLIPIIFCVVIPGAVVLLARYADINAGTAQQVTTLLGKLPAGALQDKLATMSGINQQLLYLFVNYMLTPLFLILPLMATSVVSANSFVGEKERRTLETLLFAPIEIRDLFYAKVLASLLPALALSFGGFIVTGLIVDILAYPMFGELIFPTANWLVVIFWVVPVLSLFSILVNVLISARVKGFQEAQQMSGLVALPIILLAVSQFTGLLWLHPLLLFLIGAVLLALSLFLLGPVARLNKRSVLFEKQIH